MPNVSLWFNQCRLVASYALSSEINAKNIAGTSMAFCNMASIMVGALFQPIIGKILDHLWDGTIINAFVFILYMIFR